ncbi:unnamed protein product [Urochloa humidicola]
MCQCSEPTQCHHELLLPPTKACPALGDRPRRGHGGAAAEAASILRLAAPMVGAGLLMYMRSLVSMLFLGRLGRLPLAGGSLALGFANITGYSVLSGLAAGMDPVCGQAFGAGRTSVLAAALRRTVALLLAASAPIALLWLSMRAALVAAGQDPDIAAAAHEFILFSLPDLAVQSFLHPLRVFLRAQSVTLPLTYAAAAALLLHLPINCLLVHTLRLGIRGVALAAVLANLNLLLFLLAYVYFFSASGLMPHAANAGDDVINGKSTSTPPPRWSGGGWRGCACRAACRCAWSGGGTRSWCSSAACWPTRRRRWRPWGS